MNFVAFMLVREMRASWRRLLLFFVCIAVGVGAIVGDYVVASASIPHISTGPPFERL